MLIRMSRQQIAQRVLRHVVSTPGMRMAMLQCNQCHDCSPTILSCAGHVMPRVQLCDCVCANPVQMSLTPASEEEQQQPSRVSFEKHRIKQCACRILRERWKGPIIISGCKLAGQERPEEWEKKIPGQILQAPFVKISVEEVLCRSCCARSLCEAIGTRCL